MNDLRIVFIVVAGINIVINIAKMFKEDASIGDNINAILGWTCAILSAAS